MTASFHPQTSKFGEIEHRVHVTQEDAQSAPPPFKPQTPIVRAQTATIDALSALWSQSMSLMVVIIECKKRLNLFVVSARWDLE